MHDDFEIACRDACERGIDAQSIFEEQSAEYQLKIARVFGVRVGICVIAFSYVAIIVAQIAAGFFEKHIELDATIIATTTTALAAVLGFAFGKKNGKA